MTVSPNAIATGRMPSGKVGAKPPIATAPQPRRTRHPVPRNSAMSLSMIAAPKRRSAERSLANNAGRPRQGTAGSPGAGARAELSTGLLRFRSPEPEPHGRPDENEEDHRVEHVPDEV